MKIHTQITTLATAAGLTLAAGSASAAILVVGSDSWGGGNTAALNGTFDASGTAKLVVVVSGEHGFNQSGNGTAGDVFYDGVQLTRLVFRNGINASAGPPIVLVDDTFNAIYYLDNPAAGLGAITTSGFGSRGHVGIMSLNGTAAGAGNSLVGPRDSNTLNLTTSAGSIVVGGYATGGTGNTAALGSVTTGDWDAEVSRRTNSSWDGHVVAYQNGVAAGTTDYTFGETRAVEADGRTGRFVVAAEFLDAVPEPSTTALLGLGGLALIFRRRK